MSAQYTSRTARHQSVPVARAYAGRPRRPPLRQQQSSATASRSGPRRPRAAACRAGRAMQGLGRTKAANRERRHSPGIDARLASPTNDAAACRPQSAPITPSDKTFELLSGSSNTAVASRALGSSQPRSSCCRPHTSPALRRPKPPSHPCPVPKVSCRQDPSQTTGWARGLRKVAVLRFSSWTAGCRCAASRPPAPCTSTRRVSAHRRQTCLRHSQPGPCGPCPSNRTPRARSPLR